jgi:GxxExxY protein
MESENQISYDIRGAIFKVFNELGPGLLESVYEAALSMELKEMGHIIQNQVGIPMKYRNLQFDCGFRLDIMVDNAVIVEVKSVEALADVHYKQLLTYLKLSDKKLGILINFNCSEIKENIKRIVNQL